MPLPYEILYKQGQVELHDRYAACLGMNLLDIMKPDTLVLALLAEDTQGLIAHRSEETQDKELKVVIKAGPEVAIKAEAAELQRAAGPGIPKMLGEGIIDYIDRYGTKGTLSAFAQEYIPHTMSAELPFGKRADQTWEFRSQWLHPHVLEKLGKIVQHMHSKHVLHLDLGSANNLLNPLGNPYIIDFNASLYVQKKIREVYPDIYFRSREQFAPLETRMKDQNPLELVTEETDLYSLAIMMYALLTGLELNHRFNSHMSAFHTQHDSEALMQTVKMLAPRDHWNRNSESIKKALEGLFTQATSHFYGRSPETRPEKKVAHFFYKLRKQIWNV